MLVCAGDRLAGQVVVPVYHGLFRPVVPAPGVPLVVRQVPGQHTLAGDGTCRRTGCAFDHRFHLADGLLEHHLRVLKAVDQVVQIRGDDVADTPE